MKKGGHIENDRICEIRNELSGKTGMNAEIEEDLFQRIAEIEEASYIVKPMTKTDLYLGIILAAVMGILPVVLAGAGIL